MSYTTQTYVESEFKGVTFTSSTPVTTTEITQFIEESDAYIDSRLGLLYSTPITGATALIIVRSISSLIVAARVRKILEVKSSDGGKDQPGEKGESAKAMKMLADIVSGGMVLTDASRSDYAVKDYNYSNDVEAYFDVETQQW